MVTKVQKWGNSPGLRFSKAILDEAKIGVGDEVKVLVRRGRIIVEPVSKVRRKLDIKKLVSKIPKNYRAEEIDWGPPLGREAW
jgi:antitoxin MazE